MTDEENYRRCELIDKEMAGNITAEESAELDYLQGKMVACRQEAAPLPIEKAKAIVAELRRKCEQ